MLLVGLIGLIDLVTGPDYGFAFFYLIPVVPAAWLYGRWPGIVVAVAAAGMWFFADAALKPNQAVAPIAWNAASRLAIFVAGAWLVDVVRRDRTRMHDIDVQRDEYLRVLEHELPVPAQEMIQRLNEAQAEGALDAAGIEALRHRAESLLFLTRDFVAIGQAQAKRLALRGVPLDIAQLVTEIARDRPDRDAVLVTVPGDGMLVMGDPDRLRQALADTVAHVIADAGTLDYVAVNVRTAGREGVVTVSAATPAAATRVDAEHLQVGLQLSRLLFEAMGGSLVVERSALGKGTRVTMRLPLAGSPGQAPVDATPSPRAR